MGFVTFGKKNAKEIITLLFVVGIIPIAYYSIVIGNLYATIHPQQVSVQSPWGGFTGAVKPNEPLGFFIGILSFAVLTTVWKLSCELLLIIFRCLETYIRKNSIDE